MKEKKRKIKVPRSERVFSLKSDKGPRIFRNSVACSIVEHAFSLHKLERIYQDGRAIEGDENFSQKVLDGMGVKITVSPERLAKIPKTGPVVVVANHPFGGIEGCVLHVLMASVRNDIRIMANYILGRMPELNDLFILVNPFGSAKAAKQNVRPLIESLKWLKDGGMLGVFPSGEVSSIDLKSGRVRDPAWSTTIGGIIRRSKATVVPMFISGHNGPLFQMMGLVHPRFRTMMLPSQLAKMRGSNVRVEVGAPLAWSELSKYGNDEELINYLRVRAYALEAREEPEGVAKPKRRFRLPKFHGRRADASATKAEVASAVDPEVLANEIAVLPADAKLLESGDLEVYMSMASAMPNVMRELGRLREITFRGVGEGTGREIDLDMYDDHYHHLFIWNRAKNEIVGAYRLGLADKIVARYGVNGLYTHTLFRFSEKLIDKLQPCVELGRSFVRPEYQRAYSSLLLLWKGIGAFVAQNPQYHTLFGPVSITNEYRDDSRNMMLRALSMSNFAPDLARLVKPRKPPKQKTKGEWANPAFENFVKDIDGVSMIVQDIEADRKGIPILLRQYLKLGGRILAFNVDDDFSSVVDGLIAIDLRNTEKRTLGRYMGDAETESFFKYHGVGEETAPQENA